TVDPFPPPAEVPAAVAHLVAETWRPAFTAAHAARQVAYVLWGINFIHPFADGNGRVARASSSLFLHRAVGLPLVVTPGRRLDYLNALITSRAGQIHTMVDYVF